MEIEVEIRSIVRDAEAVEEKLKLAGSFKGEKVQIDEYFLHPSRDFFGKKNVREYLRIRQQKEKASLEYHLAHLKEGKKTHSDEFVVGIEDAEKMRQLLLLLGFKEWVSVEKKRKVFECQDFEADLDEIKGLGTFLEIEAKKDFGGVEKTSEKCIAFLKEIGVKYEPSPEKGYPDMLAEKLLQKN